MHVAKVIVHLGKYREHQKLANKFSTCWLAWATVTLVWWFQITAFMFVPVSSALWEENVWLCNQNYSKNVHFELPLLHGASDKSLWYHGDQSSSFWAPSIINYQVVLFLPTACANDLHPSLGSTLHGMNKCPDPRDCLNLIRGQDVDSLNKSQVR